MTQTTQGSSPRPWYRHRWPWLLMSLPAAAVVGGVTTCIVAFRSDDGLVAQDYYTRGLEINRVLDRQERAQQLGLSAHLAQQGKNLELRLDAAREIALPEALRLTLLNPVRAGQDQAIVMQKQGNRYIGVVSGTRNGRWNLSLEDEGGLWQLYAQTRLPLTTELTLNP